MRMPTVSTSSRQSRQSRYSSSWNLRSRSTGTTLSGKTGDAGRIKQGAIFHHVDHQWVPDIDQTTGKQLATGKWGDVPNTTTLSKDDPYLEQKLTGYYQQHMGAIRKLNTTPFYNDNQDDNGGNVNPTPPPPKPAPKTAPLDPDALIKKYSQ